MELFNHLAFGTPNGLSVKDMERVIDKLLSDFDWLCHNDLTIKELNIAVNTGEITFIYNTEPWEQAVCVSFNANGSQISINSNDPNATIDVFNSLCELDWGWTEV
ncbi:hypothetical protein KDN24_06985 [Bacillus sp. Bva_UNVM-123]|uniref:hypothetical protein n=1 Tax=Bacillus sp. Bva_UNVM-123 TaxID=2829798 RepID=UPI00391EE448